MAQLHDIYPIKEDLLKSIGFINFEDDGAMAGIYFDDLIIFDGSHQCIAYDCSQSDIYPDDLFEDIVARDITYYMDQVEEEYGVKCKYFDDVSTMLSQEFGI